MYKLKLNKHNEISNGPMRNYTKEKCLEPLRKTAFPDYITYPCQSEVYQGFILKLSEVICLFRPGKKLRLKGCLEPSLD